MTRLERLLFRLRDVHTISSSESEAIRSCIEIHADEVDEYDSAIPQEVREGLRELLREESPR